MGQEGEVENTGDRPQEFVPGASNVNKEELENQAGHRIKSVTRSKDRRVRGESRKTTGGRQNQGGNKRSQSHESRGRSGADGGQLRDSA